jgi:hypothetical protein
MVALSDAALSMGPSSAAWAVAVEVSQVECARQSLEKGEAKQRSRAETFSATLWASMPTRRRAYGHDRNQVLRVSPGGRREACTGSAWAVHRASKGNISRRSSLFLWGEDKTEAHDEGAEAPPGSENTARAHVGRPGTWESPPRSRDESAVTNEIVTRPRRARESPSAEAERREVGAPHSTDEAGEPAPRDPVEGRMASSQRELRRERRWTSRGPSSSQRNKEG